MDQLPGRAGQIAALLEQSRPEALGGGLEGRRTKRIAHLAQKQWQMRLKTPPVTTDQFTPTRHLRSGLAIKAIGNCRRIDRSIRLSKGRQAAHAHSTMPAKKPPHPNQQDQSRRRGDVTMIISERFQDMHSLAIRTVFWRWDLPLMLLFGILLGGQ